MFCMNIAVADSSFKKGSLHGIVSLVDVDGLLSNERLPLNRNDHGHVAYFYREWYDTIANKCFQMCNCLETIKLSEFWDEQLDHKRGTLPYKDNDGCIFIDYIALRDAVDVTIDSLRRGCYKAVVFDAAEISMAAKDGSKLGVGPLPLQKSVMAVPVNGTLVLETRFYDEFGKVVLKKTPTFHAQTQDSSEWRMHSNKDFFLKLTVEWSQGQVATPFDYCTLTIK
ncbi:hypothetical protein Tco_1362880 [Tanacetum coccineum]